MVTSELDNTGQIALNDALNVIEGQATPVHTIGFAADAITAATLAGIAQVGNGNSVTVNTAADVRSALQTLLLLLQQGYRIDYTSGLQADDLTHRLTVSLAGAGIEAEASGELIARSRPITVTVPNVTDGGTVAGPVNLTAQADAAAPLVSVEYLLNGDVLASVADTSYSVVWNSDTVPPGAYTLVVNALDAAGNGGTTSVGFTVVAPIAVTAALAPENSDGDIIVGDDVAITADAQVFSGDARLEFYVDRVLVGTDSDAPYRTEFDSAEFAPGNHTITVVARDDSGREAVSIVDFVLVAATVPVPEPPPPTGVAGVTGRLRSFDWAQMFARSAAGLMLLLSLLAAAFAANKVRRNLAEKKLTPMRITLSNQGNTGTPYLLRGEDPQGALTFRFSLNGTTLGMPPIARYGSGETATAGNGARPGAAGGPALPGVPGNVAVPTGQDVGNWMDQASEASGVATIIISILQSIAYILPPSLARPLRSFTMQIRRGQMMVRRVEMVQKQVGRLNQTEMGQKMVQTTGEAVTNVGEYATSDSTRSAVAGGANRGAARHRLPMPEPRARSTTCMVYQAVRCSPALPRLRARARPPRGSGSMCRRWPPVMR